MMRAVWWDTDITIEDLLLKICSLATDQSSPNKATLPAGRHRLFLCRLGREKWVNKKYLTQSTQGHRENSK